MLNSFTYILSLSLRRLHDVRKPSPLSLGIGIGDRPQARVSGFAALQDATPASHPCPPELHLVHYVLHVEVHIQRNQTNPRPG